MNVNVGERWKAHEARDFRVSRPVRGIEAVRVG